MYYYNYLLMLSVCWLNLQQTEAGCWMVGGWELFIYLLHWVLVRSPGSGGFCPRDIMACVASVGKVCHPRRITAVSSMAMVVFVCVSRDSWNSTSSHCGLSVSLHWGIGVCSLRSQCHFTEVSVGFGCCSFVVLIHHGQHFSHKNQMLFTSCFFTEKRNEKLFHFHS